VRAEVISIGTELLLGHIVDTNKGHISRKMAEIGIDVLRHSTVGDNPKRLSALLRRSLLRSDIVFTIGGLGPTVDDITVETVSKTLSRKLVFNKQIAKQVRSYFKRRRYKFPEHSLRQAYVPEGAICPKNDVGTAPGLIIPLKDKVLICLPGPPVELVPIVQRDIIPYIKKHFKATEFIKSHSIRLAGIPEATVNTRVKDLLKLSGSTTLGIYARLGEVELKITSKAKSEKEYKKNVKKIVTKIRKRLSSFIYGTDDESLEEAVGILLKRNKKTLAIAESCTGGLISDRITNVSGSSKYFKMGVIAYSNKVKTSILGVPTEILKKHGAVSKECALSMAKGIKKIANADIGISVTGIAGPGGGTKKKPVGLVYITLVIDKKNISKKYLFSGKRNDIKILTSQLALNLIRTNLING